jgi:signal transduction histidine kinase
MTFSDAFRAHPRWAVLAEMLALSVAIGWADFCSGWELSLFVLYAVPILIVVWFVNRAYGLVFAVVAAWIWWLANKNEHPYQTVWGYYVATFSRLVYFLFVAIGGAALKANREADQARISALERERQLEQEIVRVSEREQQRIGRDLHDGLCQYLAAVSLSVRSLADDLTAAEAPHAEEAREIEGLLREAVNQSRSLARGIFPVRLDGSGLALALDEMAATTRHLTSINVRFEENGNTQIPDSHAGIQLYRIAQEALSNAMNHSEGSRIVISLHREDGELRLVVSDNGKGFSNSSTSSAGLGLGTMKYRAHAIGARLDISPGPERGTRVVCRVPIDRCNHSEAHV